MPNGIYRIYTRPSRQNANSFRSDRQNSCGTESPIKRCFRDTRNECRSVMAQMGLRGNGID